MTPIIFLDVDGVVAPNTVPCQEVLCGQIHRDKVKLLNRVLRETDARIVLSSSWRYIVYRGEATLAGMDWLFRSHGLIAGRIVGITRRDTMRNNDNYTGKPGEWNETPVADERGKQIDDWIWTHRHEGRYVAVDDLDLGITAAGHPLVLTDGTVGLVEADAVEMVRILSGGKP